MTSNHLTERVQRFLDEELGYFIGNDWLLDKANAAPVVDPSTEDEITTVPHGSDSAVAAAFEAGEKAGSAWRNEDFYSRYRALGALADLVYEHVEDLAVIDSLDSGNPLVAMRRDVHEGAKQLRYIAAMGLSVRGETMPGTVERLHYTLREPFGVVGRIIPFNHPAMFAIAKIAAPLIAGNTVVLKPAEQTPLSALYLGKLLAEALPPGVVNIVTGGADAGRAIVRHPRIRRISFTGSVETGRAIQRDAADVGVKHVSLELGGKNPMVVCNDASLEKAAKAAVTGMNLTVCQGQSCGSNSRIFVHEELYEAFAELVSKQLSELRLGPAYLPDTQMGPVVDQRQFSKVMGYVELAKRDARILSGGSDAKSAGGGRGYFIQPTLVDGVDFTHALGQEEIFGPVITMFKWSDLEEIVQSANAVSYGLTASIWTDSLDIAHRAASRIEAGYVWVNEHGPHYVGTPFGGYKESGVGKEEARDEIEGYLQTKSVHIAF